METAPESQEINYGILSSLLIEIWKTQGNFRGVTLPTGTSPLLIADEVSQKRNGPIKAFLGALIGVPHETDFTPTSPDSPAPRTAAQTPPPTYGGSPDSQ